MNVRNRNISVLLMAIFCITVQCLCAQNLSSLTHKYEAYFDKPGQGIGILVKRKGEIEFSSIGDIGLSAESVFNIGSATKKLTAILLLQEVDKGNLSLSDSIGSYLGVINNVDGSLTIESLLRHRSGLGETVGEEYEKQFFSDNRFLNIPDILDRIPKNNPDLIGKYDYCNTNYFLLGCLLENVTDKSYFDLLRERIFEPCGMEDSYPYVSKDLEHLVHPIHNGKDVYNEINHKYFALYAYAAGSVASTLADQEKLYTHLFESNTLLQKQSLDKLISFDDAGYGLGMRHIEIIGEAYYGHGGNNLGYAYREYYNPETRDLFLLFSNAYSIPFSDILKKDCANYMSDENVLVFKQDLAVNYANSIGTYFFKEMNMELEVLKKQDGLFLSVQGVELLLISMENNKLITTEYGIELEVNPDNSEKITFRQNGMEAIIEKITAE